MSKPTFFLSAISLSALALMGASCSAEPREAQAPEAAAVHDAVMEDTMQEDTNSEDSMQEEQQYTVDTSASSFAWTARKVVGPHNGTIDISEGTLIANDEGQLIGGEFTADMTTIVDLDIQDEKMNQMLTNDLKSENFFDVEKFPTATFTITNIAKEDGATYQVAGDMTIRGITQNISFPAEITVEGDQIRATANVELDRTLFDIKFRSGKFFSDLGDKLIDDMFQLEINLVANKA
jgi:polyisoprenoid-binding protein YceI